MITHGLIGIYKLDNDVALYSSMITHGLIGIYELDKDVALYKAKDGTPVIAGFTSLRQVLGSNVKLGSGHTLIADCIRRKQWATWRQ